MTGTHFHYVHAHAGAHTCMFTFRAYPCHTRRWELFNEAEHGYTVDEYIHDYDILVSAMIDAVGAESAPHFMGIGGASPSWVGPFLNTTNHMYGPDKQVCRAFRTTIVHLSSTYMMIRFSHIM